MSGGMRRDCVVDEDRRGKRVKEQILALLKMATAVRV